MTESAASLKSKLDWTKLLGFDQASRNEGEQSVQRLADPRMAKLGNKAGTKPGVQRLSDPRMAKLGAKIGVKFGGKSR